MSKSKKTNAVRLIEQQKLPYTLIEYKLSDGLVDGVSVAEKTGKAMETVFKTLVTRANNGQIYVFLLPVAMALDLKKGAKAAGVKKIDLLPLDLLTKETGYIRGGCSPIGMKKAYPVFIDQSAERMEEIIVSGGRPGLQLSIQLDHLLQLTNAEVVLLQK